MNPILILKFHQREADCCVANVLGPVCEGITIDDVAGSELRFSDGPVNRMTPRCDPKLKLGENERLEYHKASKAQWCHAFSQSLNG
jgi:hypothetical protein